MSDELFQPSLTKENYIEQKTYQISRLFYLAFFGGMVPIIVLGTRNANWLQINKKMITVMVVIGSTILLLKAIIGGLIYAGFLTFDTDIFRWIYRIACVLLYLGYYFLMKEKYKQFIMTGGKTQPLLKDAIIWIIIGIIVEICLIVTAEGIISNVL